MTKPIDKTSNELFQLLRSRFSPVNLGNQDAESTSGPNEARFFSFIYKENGRALGPISISIVNNRSLKIFYSNDVVDSMKDSASWYAFLKELRFFSKRNLLAFDARDINKDQLDTRDYDFIKKVDGPYQERDVEVTESSMFGSRRKSYQTVGNAKLVVAHRKSVDENVKGARSRYIESIFVECNGERFRFPVNYLNGARAMAVHVSEGGTPYDDLGQHIISTVAEMANLSKFARMTRKHAMEDAEAGDIRSKVIEAYNAKKKSILRLHNPKNYKEFAEAFTKSEATGDSDTTMLKERFTLKVWNENMEDLLPSVQRALEGYTMTEDNIGPDHVPDFYWELANWVDEWAYENGVDYGDEHSSVDDTADTFGELGIDSKEAAMDWAKKQAQGREEMEWDVEDAAESAEPLEEAASSVERMIADPNFVLVLRKDPAADSMIKNAKFTNGGGLLGFILSDIASRAIGNDVDAVANFASEMALQIGDEGASFGTKITPEYKKDKGLAMLLAKKYIDDMKKMAGDPAYAAQVRKDPGEVYGAKKTRTGGFHEAVASFENWANALLEAGTVATTGTTGTGITGTGGTAAKATNPTIIKALSDGDPNKARDLKRVADKLARGQRLSPQEAPIAGEIAKDVMTSKKTNAATQAMAEAFGHGSEEWGANVEDVKDAIIHRLQVTNKLFPLLKKYGLDRVEDAVMGTAEFHADAAELGSSDISIMVNQVLKDLGEVTKEGTITEKALRVSADQDFDGDGKLESPKAKYAGSKDNAIRSKLKKPAIKSEDEQIMAESLSLLKKFAGI